LGFGNETPPIRIQYLSDNQTICHEFPKVFDFQGFHTVFFFHGVELAVAAMTGDHEHIGPGCPDLVELAPGVKNPLLIISRSKRTSASAAADLVHLARIQIPPVIHALTQDPPGLFKETVSEVALSLSAVVAGVMIRGHAVFEPGFVQADFLVPDVFDEEIEHGDEMIFFQDFRIMRFEPRPGC